MAQDPGCYIRMRGASGQFEHVRGPEAKEIRKAMKQRVDALLPQLAAFGLHRRGGESPVVLPGGERKSIDLRCWYAPRGETCILEMKWTRRSIPRALASARNSFSWLKQAGKKGVWLRSRKKISATLIGALVVGPSHWTCELQRVPGSWTTTFTDSDERPSAVRKKRKYRSGACKRRGNTSAQAVEEVWRRSAEGRALQSRVDKRHYAKKRPAAA